MKKTVALVLCLVMVMTLAIGVFASGIVKPGKLPLVIGNVPKTFIGYVEKLAAMETTEKGYEAALQQTEDYYKGLDETNRALPEVVAAYDQLLKIRAAFDAANSGETPTTGAPEVPTTGAPEAPTTAAPEAPTTAAPEAPTTAAPEAPTTAAPEAPTTAAPEAPTTAAPEAPTQPSTPSEPVDPAGDNTFMVLAMVMLSMTALVVLVSKKRAI